MIWILVGLAALVLIGAWFARRSSFGASFVIRVRRDGIVMRGQPAGRSPANLKAFLHGLSLPAGVVIEGHGARPPYRIHIRGSVSEGTAQRIRNYLLLP